MTEQGPGWEESKVLAQAILRNRKVRRRWIGGLLLLPLVMLVLGLGWMDDWLESSQGRFLAWWTVCALATGFVLLCALYDALAVIREERERQKQR